MIFIRLVKISWGVVDLALIADWNVPKVYLNGITVKIVSIGTL